jgi:hypothetical protein
MVELPKADVLKSHIDSAVILIAYESAYVSAHTLVMACEEIIRTLSDKKGKPYQTDWRSRVNPIYKGKEHTFIRSNYNFFKHADRDIDEVLELEPEDVRCFNETFLFSFITGYSTLFENLSVTSRTYVKWAAACGDAIDLDAIPHSEIFKKAIAYIELDTPVRKRDLLRQWLDIPTIGDPLPANESAALFSGFDLLFIRHKKSS